MEWTPFIFFLLILVLLRRARAQRRKRVKEAYTFQKPNIHGSRKYADRNDLKKAGLL